MATLTLGQIPDTLTLPAPKTATAHDGAAAGASPAGEHLSLAEDLQQAFLEREVTLDDFTAQELVGRVAALQSRADRLEAEHAARLAGIERELKSLAWQHGQGLENWVRERLRGHRRKKSVETAEGRAGIAPTGIRTGPEKDAPRVSVEVLDADEVATWCAIQPDAETYGRAMFRVDWPELKKLVAQGLIVPGTRTGAAPEKLYVQAKGLKKQVNLSKLRATPLGPEVDEDEFEEEDEAPRFAGPEIEEE